MVKEDILGGLKSAISRGFSLREAMMSFYNAGYARNDIEDAARTVQYELAQKISTPAQTQTATSSQAPMTSAQGVPASLIVPSKMKVSEDQRQEGWALANAKNLKGKSLLQELPQKESVKGRVSSYLKQNPRIKTITVVLIIILLVLLGILGIMFLFKTQIIDFFNGLF